MSKPRIILKDEKFKLCLERLAEQLIETYNDFENVCLIGIQEKGVVLSKRLLEIINKKKKRNKLVSGALDITFYRDDFRTRSTPLKANETDISFMLDGKKVILVDDVLYSGRTIQSALSALQDFGRAESVQLLVMVDRRFNRHVPIQADYIGTTVDALDEAYVKVEHESIDGQDQILLFSLKKQSN